MSKIRVLIVEDSAVVRHLLEQIIDGDERLEVVSSVSSAEEALRVLPTVRPDIISMDINLPGMDGLEATHRIMTDQPTPIVVVSSSISNAEAKMSLDALRAGALAVADKPVGTTHPSFAAQARQLTNRLALMSEVPVVRQRPGRIWRSTPPTMKPSAGSFPRPAVDAGAERPRFLGVVASTGGPQALVKVFNDLGVDFPLPILLVQHITAAFVASFAAWLDGVVPFSVTVAEEGNTPRSGHIYLAPADKHLLLMRARANLPVLKLEDSPQRSGQRPSGTRLFESMAESFGPVSVGVLLTGMGDDGADGMLALRRAGGHTIAEDATTAIVYGMPAAAVQRGAAVETAPLGMVARRVLDRVHVTSDNEENVETGSHDFAA